MGYMIGEFEVVEKLGSGAMGDVFKARNPKTNEFVAIKILSEELSNNPRAVERFKREIAQTIKLDHPNLISAYTAGEFKGRLYYVMEFVEGVTAKKELLTRGVYEEFRAIEIVMQVAKALEYAAQFGIIHRDIKPDNIMITYDGKAKLCDMGLAKSTQKDTDKLTIMGTVLGTPHYMSPEQAQGDENLDTRTDLFSLGATWYHLVTGSPPFEGPDPISIMTMLIEEEPVPIQERNPKVSDAICAVISKMMAKDRNKRYQTFTELLQDLYKLKKKEITSAQLAGNLPQARKQARFQECFVPSEGDVLIAQIAIHNKITTPDKVEEALVRQESLALMGMYLNLVDILVEIKSINPQQNLALEKAKMQFILDRGDENFNKICSSNNLLGSAELAEVQKFKRTQSKGVGAHLVAQKIIDDEKREKIFSSVRHAMIGEEGKLLLKVALENNLVSKSQAEKCSRIYTNNVVMGKFKDIGSILVEKGFLSPEAHQALLRAVRRTMLTGKPAAQYLNEIKIVEKPESSRK